MQVYSHGNVFINPITKKEVVRSIPCVLWDSLLVGTQKRRLTVRIELQLEASEHALNDITAIRQSKDLKDFYPIFHGPRR